MIGVFRRNGLEQSEVPWAQAVIDLKEAEAVSISPESAHEL